MFVFTVYLIIKYLNDLKYSIENDKVWVYDYNTILFTVCTSIKAYTNFPMSYFEVKQLIIQT